MYRHNFDNTTLVKLEKDLTEDIKKFIKKAFRTNKLDELHVANSMAIGRLVFLDYMKRDRWDLIFCLWIANEVGYPINLEAGKKLVNITPPGFAYRDLEEE